MPCLLQLKANQLETKPEGALAQISMAHAQVCHKWSQVLVLDLRCSQQTQQTLATYMLFGPGR
eukprot:SAG31_NODE_29237_length_398_cov_2.374582_1_plen_62_part_01